VEYQISGETSTVFTVAAENACDENAGSFWLIKVETIPLPKCRIIRHNSRHAAF